MHRQLLLAALFLVTPGLCQTPVIGGTCRLGTADVQIGGKQTQFFLKCEATSDSAAGEGVWVVKSRAASAAAAPSGSSGSSSASGAAVPVENTQLQQHPKLMRKHNAPNICEQDNDAREADSCAVSATCLQASQDIPSSYLQCDQTTMRWIRKSCQDGFIFNFEQQTCIVPKRMSSLSHLRPLSCPDGSGALGICPCVFGTFCTAQNLCCPIPSLKPKPRPHVARFVSYKKHRRQSKRLEHRDRSTDRRRTNHKATTFATSSLISMTSGAADGGSCTAMSASCLVSEDCPPWFACKNGCCQLDVCPGGTKVLFTCTSLYQCRAGEKCIFGGCCPQVQKTSLSKEPRKAVELTTVSADLEVKGNDDPYNNFETLLTKTKPVINPYDALPESGALLRLEKAKTKTTQMPSATPIDDCEVDEGVEECSLENPCPEASECLSGRCCKMKVKRCKNGLFALSIPRLCKTSDECPISSICEKHVCCPTVDDLKLDEADESDREEANLIETEAVTLQFKSATAAPRQKTRSEGGDRKISTGLANRKPTCLAAHSCSPYHGMGCPAGYTCTLDGRCCQISTTCPDGSAPEWSCSETMPCQTSHLCFTTEENHSICCPRGQQATTGLVCTYSSCSNTNPCSTGTCNNGYCCSSGSVPSYAAVATRKRRPRSAQTNSTTNVLEENDWPIGPPGYGFPHHLADLDTVLVKAAGDGIPTQQSSCVGCSPPVPVQIATAPVQYAPQSTAILCPGGTTPIGSCSNGGYCPTGYSCVNRVCCPAMAQVPMPVPVPVPARQMPYVPMPCPTGVPPVGGCINGACATGYSCINNQCCISPVTKNPFVCPNGNQAAGGCVNGQCGEGYTCQNGLCCLGTVGSAVRCLDGSEAIGACIPSCTGGNCGNIQISYYCGTGYTCTTGNICCPISSCPNGGDPIGPPVNGLCPEGYTLQGNMCCSNVGAGTCPDGSVGTPAVNGICPAGTQLINNVCCPLAAAAQLVGQCETPSMGNGPCTAAGCTPGYACDNDPTNPQCCPVVNYRDPQYQIGPAVAGMCPPGYVAVYPPSTIEPDGSNPGVCVDLQTVPGVCAVAVQAGPCNNQQCPTGYTCNVYADVCCPSTTTFSKIGRPAQPKRPSYGRPLHSYMPHSARPETCPDGSNPVGLCVNSLCGIGLECQNGNCCPLITKELKIRSQCPNGESAVSNCFPNGGCGSRFECVRSINLCCPPGGNDIAPTSPVHNNVRPIGGRCFVDGECVGHSEGLSLCHAGVCQCSPIAYSQGIACVRRFKLKMNDSPLADDGKETNAV